MEKISDALHIAVLPNKGLNNLRSFLPLSKAITRFGHHVYFFSTKSMIQMIEAQEAPTPYMQFFSLSGEGSIDAFQEALADFLRATSPIVDWILYDFKPYWVPSVAAHFSVRSTYICVNGATTNAFMWPILREGERPTVERLIILPHSGMNVAFSAYEACDVLHQLFDEDESGYSVAARTRMCMDDADVVAVQSSAELEGEWLWSLESICQKPVLTLGHLPPTAPSTELSYHSEIARWQIYRFCAFRVIWERFGIDPAHVEELTNGIEDFGVPFVCGLRYPASNTSGLPEGFQERKKGRELLSQGWVSQVDILAHHAVGGFMSHCGWNSVLESLQFGVPHIMLPLHHDEFLNARMLARNKL